ncbi:hypothetical protein PMI31_03295 [Pseudomonas sp. GM55]|nr:hypothetical protein PMI31_03295 [Pseudomonas sp. GM55]
MTHSKAGSPGIFPVSRPSVFMRISDIIAYDV